MYHDVPFIISGILYSIVTTINDNEIDESGLFRPGHSLDELEYFSGLVFDASIIPCLFEYRVHFLAGCVLHPNCGHQMFLINYFPQIHQRERRRYRY